MAVLAQGSITIYHVKDIASVTWYYKLQSSTLSPPDKPTTSPPPTAWKTSEPSYNEGSTDSLYVVERTIFSDGTFSYSDVSLSSSYEAAKTAYNKAANANTVATETQEALDNLVTVATETQEALDNLVIGGRNLIKNTLNPDVSAAAKYPRLIGQEANTAVPGGTKTVAEHGFKIEVSSATLPYVRFGSGTASSGTMNGLVAGETYTLSFDASWKVLSGTLSGTTTNYMRAYLYTDKTTTGTFVSTEYSNFGKITYEDRGDPMSGRCEFTFTVPDTATMLYLVVRPNLSTSAAYAAGDYLELRNLKLEKGNRATDWTPAPEDTYGDRLKYSSKVTVSTAINAGALGVFNASGGLIPLSTTAFDVTMPILYTGSDMPVGENTDTSTYTALGDWFDLTKTKSGFTGTAGKPVYIVGTLSGKMFTPDSEIFTCTEPLTQNGKSYMLLGTMTSATGATLYSEHPILQYYNGGFKTTGMIAIEAAIEANTAYETADGKNSVFYSSSPPTVTGRKDGDLWFDTDDHNKLYTFSSESGSWEARLFGNNALYNNIDAGKITAGELDASKVNVTNLNASNISSGTIDASKISVTNIAANQITSGYLSAERIASGSIITRMLNTKAVTAEKIDVSDLYAIAAYIGAIHITQSSIYSGSHTTYNSSNAGFYLDKNGKFGVGNSAGYIRWNGSSLAIAASTLSWTANNSSMTSEGVLTATGANITGTITATYGSIGGWNVNSYRLWKQSSEISSGDLHQVYLQSAATSTGDDPTESTNAMVIARRFTSPSSPVWKNLYELKYDGSLTSYGYELNGNVMRNILRTILTNGGLEVRIGKTWNSSGSMTAYDYLRLDVNGITSNHYFTLGGSAAISYSPGRIQGYDAVTMGTTNRYLGVSNSAIWMKSSYRSSGTAVISDCNDYLTDGTGQDGRLFYSSSSSKRYKDYIGEETEADALKLLELPVVQFRYKEGYLDNDDENYDRTMVGLFAEDVAEQFEDAVYHKGGYVENYTDRQLLVRLIKLVQMQHREIEQLKQAAS